MNALKKIGCTVMAILTVSTCAVTATVSDSSIAKNFSIVNVIDASAEKQQTRLYNQLDNKWNNEYNLKNSGCGIFSFCNAIYSLNGYRPNPNTVAKWALSKNAYDKNLGLYRDVFYDNIQKKYGSIYKFKVVTKKYANVEDTTLINALRNQKKVAVAHVKNHFIAIVNYRVKNNIKQYYVIESAVSNTRGLSATGWVSANKLKSGNTKVDWFVVLESTK